MKCDKNFVVILLVILSLSLVSSEGCASSGMMGRFQQGSNVTLTQTCPTCTFINITIKDPTSNILVLNKPMTFSQGTFNFTNESISAELGTYTVEGQSNLDVPLRACFVITNVKREIDTPQSVIFIILASVVFLVLLASLWGAIALPFQNRTNDEFRIIGIESLKYFKMALIFLSFALAVWFSNLIFTMSNNLVTLTQYNGFFEMIFIIMRALIWPVFVIMIVAFFVVGYRDLQLEKLLSRGIQPRS